MADGKCWMVWRDGMQGVVTFGPFESKEAAEDFASRGGHVYDAVAHMKSPCGPWFI